MTWFLSPTGARVEEFLYEKLDRKVPSRVTNGELLAQYMAEAASELGPTTPYGEPGPAAGGAPGLWPSFLSLHPPLPRFVFLIIHIIPEFMLSVKTSNSRNENRVKNGGLSQPVLVRVPCLMGSLCVF